MLNTLTPDTSLAPRECLIVMGLSLTRTDNRESNPALKINFIVSRCHSPTHGVLIVFLRSLIKDPNLSDLHLSPLGSTASIFKILM